MDELVKRSDVLVAYYDDFYSHDYFPFEDVLNSVPAVDAVKVVRCKDCIRRYDSDECPMCYVSGGQYYEYTSGNGYCDRGERKEDG